MRREPGERAFLAVAGCGYGLLTAVFLAPLLRQFATHIAPDPGDPIFTLTVLSWVGERLLAGGGDLWSPSFFHPARLVLTYSDHFLGPGLVFGVLRRIGASPAAAYNTLVLSSFALSGLVTCWVIRRAGHSRFAAFVAGVVFAFAPYKWDQLPHIQMLFTQWIPALLWCWHRFLDAPSRRRALAFLFFYTLHLLGGNYLAYLIHIPLGLMLAARLCDLPRDGVAKRGWLTIGAASALAGALAFAVFRPYLEPVAGVATQRQTADFHAWGATLASFFTPSPVWAPPRLDPFVPTIRPENGLFVGLPVFLLAVLGGWMSWRRFHMPSAKSLSLRQRGTLHLLALVAAVAYVAADVLTWSPIAKVPPPLGRWYGVLGLAFAGAALAWLALRRAWGGSWPLRFGPDGRWARAMALTGGASFLLAHPMIFVLLTNVLPGMGRMRVPTRVFAILLLPLACLAAAGAGELLRRAAENVERRALAAVALVWLMADLAPLSLAPNLQYLPRERELPEVYRWIGAAADVGGVLELPIYADHRELNYQYAWLAHRKPLLNGYSGQFPLPYQRLAQVCAGRRAVTVECFEEARRMGATHVVLHSGSLLFERQRPKARPLGPATAALVEVVYSDPKTQVFRFRDRSD